MKILLYTDLAIRKEELFWHRDLGLLTRAFRDLGHNAYLVVHPAEPGPVKTSGPKDTVPQPTQSEPPANPSGDPVIWATPRDVRNPEWWKSHQPDFVVLGLWTRPKYDSVRRAALAATPRLMERADSDGMRTASCNLGTYARRRYDYFRDRTSRWPRFPSFLAAVLYSVVSIFACPWMEARLSKTLRLIPDLVVESRGAAEHWRSLLRRLRVTSRVHHIPHPVQADLFRYRESWQKEKRVVAVGRWDAYQKNRALLLSTLSTFLRRHPDWAGIVIGSGLASLPPHPRIKFVPAMAAASLAETMGKSMILFFTSHYESFLLAGAEALVAGCSVVGPETLVATRQLVEIQTCQVSDPGKSSLLEVLEREQKAWEEGKRDPEQISSRATAAFSSHAVAQGFLSLVHYGKSAESPR